LRGEDCGESVTSFPLFDKERDQRVSSYKYPLFFRRGGKGVLTNNYFPLPPQGEGQGEGMRAATVSLYNVLFPEKRDSRD